MGGPYITGLSESTSRFPIVQAIELPSVPDYLSDTYWWAYLHPRAVSIFERQWIVNLILWGNFARLRDAALGEMGKVIDGRTLQMACVYGNFTPKLVDRLSPGARLDAVDIAPIQLENLGRKVSENENVFLHLQDASMLSFGDGSFDQVVVFFLLHELPLDVRIRVVQEALRVTKPGGKIIFMDYHRPAWLHPHRYLMVPILKLLEPFALDLWENEISDWIPKELEPRLIQKRTYFGGLYQKVIVIR